MNEIIARKKAGQKLSAAEISRVVNGVTSGEIPDYQVTALLMAICFQGMDVEERASLTRAMAASGRRLDFSAVKGTKTDKHSTGGVGDKTSLVLAPWLAAAGVKVPMISGRGLGFTGGTLDKLAAIPGYRIDYSEAELTGFIRDVGCFIIGQTADIAPADKKIYALRDVTATVDEISLITASILSKKLAEGLDTLVMDVKCGSGAFMQDFKSARALARSIADTAGGAGVKTVCLITTMDFPLGRYTGNTIETLEAIEFCKNDGIYFRTAEKLFLKREKLTPGEKLVASLVEITVELAVHMLDGMAQSQKATRKKNLATLFSLWQNGTLLKKCREWISAQGGDISAFTAKATTITDAFEANTPDICTYTAPRPGYLTRADGRALGHLMVELGAGRRKSDDLVDDRVSLEMLNTRADRVNKGDPVFRIYKPGLTGAEREQIQATGQAALTISAAKPRPVKNILAIL